LKGGTITPIPKKDKSRLLTDNYRGITITAVLGKILEQMLLNRMHKDQSALQFGFTSGASPSMAALLLTEAMAESRDQNRALYVSTLDAVKAFDTVCHASLMCKLFHHNTDLETLGTIMSLYQGSTGRVKWNGDLGDPFEVLQGVRQGGVLSPRLYKEYIDGLLQRLEAEGDGLHIGTTYVGSPTVADDVLLLTHSPLDLQVMLDSAD
jgi:retron-type reverse transcriptase